MCVDLSPLLYRWMVLRKSYWFCWVTRSLTTKILMLARLDNSSIHFIAYIFSTTTSCATSSASYIYGEVHNFLYKCTANRITQFVRAKLLISYVPALRQSSMWHRVGQKLTFFGRIFELPPSLWMHLLGIFFFIHSPFSWNDVVFPLLM